MRTRVLSEVRAGKEFFISPISLNRNVPIKNSAYVDCDEKYTWMEVQKTLIYLHVYVFFSHTNGTTTGRVLS